MTGFDYTVIVIVILSAMLGWWRGVVVEVLSLMGWIGAVFLSLMFSARLAPYLPDALGAEATRTVAAFVILFVGTLIVSGIAAGLLSKLVKWVGLGGLEKSLGTLFGMLRGVLLVLILVLLAGLTGLPQQPFWRDAALSKPLQRVALSGLAMLPDSVAQRVTFQRSVTSDK